MSDNDGMPLTSKCQWSEDEMREYKVIFSRTLSHTCLAGLLHRLISNSIKLSRYRDKGLSFDSAQDDVTLSGVEVLSTLKSLYIKLKIIITQRPARLRRSGRHGVTKDKNKKRDW